MLPAGPLLPKHVPSFAAVLHGRVAPGFPLEQMFATARIVKERRVQVFSAVEEQLYLDLYEMKSKRVGGFAIHNYEDRGAAEVCQSDELFLGHFPNQERIKRLGEELGARLAAPVLSGDVLLVRNGEEMAAFRLSLAGH